MDANLETVAIQHDTPVRRARPVGACVCARAEA
jgi:hypothetical protein